MRASYQDQLCLASDWLKNGWKETEMHLRKCESLVMITATTEVGAGLKWKIMARGIIGVGSVVLENCQKSNDRGANQ